MVRDQARRQALSSDEKRAIRLLSQAFVDKGRVWHSAVIVFTFAGMVNAEEFSNALAKRTELIRREIALHAGAEIAAKVPSVAIENKADTTPDGKPWRGELYVKVLTSMNREESSRSSSAPRICCPSHPLRDPAGRRSARSSRSPLSAARTIR